MCLSHYLIILKNDCSIGVEQGSNRVGSEELLNDPNLTWTDWAHDSGTRVNSSFQRICGEFKEWIAQKLTNNVDMLA